MVLWTCVRRHPQIFRSLGDYLGGAIKDALLHKSAFILNFIGPDLSEQGVKGVNYSPPRGSVEADSEARFQHCSHETAAHRSFLLHCFLLNGHLFEHWITVDHGPERFGRRIWLHLISKEMGSFRGVMHLLFLRGYRIEGGGGGGVNTPVS